VFVGQALARDLGKRLSKAVGIVERVIRGGAVVVQKRLLIQIAEQLERLNAHIRSVDAALEKAPVVLQPVGVNLSIDIGDCVVNDLMDVFPVEPIIGPKGIGVECGPSFDMLANCRLESQAFCGP
jgi:hypothetical protein